MLKYVCSSDTGDVHKVTRNHILPLFHRHNLEQLVPAANTCARKLVNDLSKHVGRGHVDVLYSVGLRVLESIVCKYILE